MLLGARHFLFNRIQQPTFELPYDAEVEYLESTGTQWIDTGFYPTVNTKVKATVTPTQIDTIFGVREADFTNSFCLTFTLDSGNNKCFSGQIGNSTTNQLKYIKQTSAVQYEVELSKDGVFINENKVAEFADPQPFTPYGTLYLFARNDQTGSKRGHARIRRFKIIDNGIVVRDYVPVRVGTTGYMYDTVSRTLAENHGEFTFGSDLSPIEYISANASSVIKTDIIVTDEYSVECDFTNSAVDSTYRPVLGVRSSDGAANSFVINAVSTTSTSFAYSTGKYEEFPVPELKVRHHAVLRKGYAALDSLSTTSMNASIVPNSNTLAICARNNNNSYGNNFKGKIFDIKMFKNGILYRHLVPVKINSETPVGALLDVMWWKLYTDMNTNLTIPSGIIDKKFLELY